MPGFGRRSGARFSDDTVTATASILPAADNQPLRLSITAEISDGWHIFSLTQAPGGPKRTRIVFAVCSSK